MKRKLYKSSTEKVVCGVCGGIAEYLDVDVTLVRLIWIAVTILGGIGILPYLLAALIIPSDEPYTYDK